MHTHFKIHNGNFDYNNNIQHEGQLTLATSKYWTSGTMAAENNGKWCTYNGRTDGTVSMPTDLNWLQKTSATASNETFVLLELSSVDAGKSGLKFADGTQKNLFICEAS
jgi:hypothetical protein